MVHHISCPHCNKGIGMRRINDGPNNRSCKGCGNKYAVMGDGIQLVGRPVKGRLEKIGPNTYKQVV